jgi:4-amino-4-deoxy-L-arabinose transferase-like glycosyltransferase
LCAAFYALTALCIQQAHFFVADTFAATFIVAAFHCALRASTAGMRAWLFDVLCGLCLGAALACKFSSVLFVVVVIAFLIARQRKGDAWLVPTISCLFTAFTAFRISHPIAFRGEGGAPTLWGLLDVRLHPQFWNALGEQAAITRGAVDVPFNLQWFDRAAFLYPLWNLGEWAIGWPLLICSIGALLLVASRVLRRKPLPTPLILSALWVTVVFLFYGAQFSKFTRYYLPALPFVALLAAWWIIELWNGTQLRKAKIVIALGSAGVLLYSLLWSLAVTSIYTRVHPRVAATQWILNNIPAGTTIANETKWDDALPLRHAQRYQMHDLELFDADSAQKRDHMLQTLNDVQWIFVSSPRVWKIIPRLPQRFPLTAQYYRALFDGSLGFERARAFSSYPQLLGKSFPDENFEEALLVYDHPRVLLFRKTAEYSASKAARLLSKELME